MKKNLIAAIALLFSSSLAFGQIDTLTGDAAKAFISQLNLDTTRFVAASGKSACKCIDSITLMRKGSSEVSQDIADCIDREVSSYQLAQKLYQSMTGKAKDNNISLNVDKRSPEYKKYYFEIESWLRDSCASLIRAVASNNEEATKSVSNNKKARDEYNEGIRWMEKDNLEKALASFEKAVKIDPEFAFAWDNIGICNRKLGRLDEALVAYNKSLEIEPAGVLPLHNIPVVYEYQKKYDKALAAYLNLQQRYKDDPEGFYGAARMYIVLEDMEKGLRNMCQAYKIYASNNSPYRVDAEKNISYLFGKMKEAGKEKLFYEILKEYNLSSK